MKQVVVLADAADDIAAAQDFYQTREPNTGAYFVDSLLADIENLNASSGIHALHFEFHRKLASRFPFGIYYRELGEQIQVVAVLDLRRRPNWIRSELRARDQ